MLVYLRKKIISGLKTPYITTCQTRRTQNAVQR